MLSTEQKSQNDMAMNKQLKMKDGKVVGRGIEWTDFTWNPISGCKHACRWNMPNGEIAICYAENVAENVAQSAYPHGFEHHYWKPDMLNEPFNKKTPARIFVGSMADVYGGWVPMEEIMQVHEAMKKAPWHHFQSLTKAFHRLPKVPWFPDNQWVGVSSPPDHMGGVELPLAKKFDYMHRTMMVLRKLKEEGKIKLAWMSMEPLSNDYAPIVAKYPDVLDWVVIGAASDGPRYMPPVQQHVEDMLKVLRKSDTRVFFKGNMSSMGKWATDGNWFEEMPKLMDKPVTPVSPETIEKLKAAVDNASIRTSVATVYVKYEGGYVTGIQPEPPPVDDLPKFD